MSRKLIGLIVATVALAPLASVAVAGDGGEGGTATTLSKYALSPATFAVKKSTKIKVTSDKEADVRFTVKRRSGGDELDGRLTKKIKVGSNTFSWNGKLDGDQLRPGSYWLIASVLSDGGKTNPAKKTAFKIVR